MTIQKKRIVKIVSVLLIFLSLVLLAIVDYLSDTEERFKISDFSVKILYPKDKKESCYNLYQADNTFLNKHQKILAIKFKLDYISIRREHLFNHMPPGGEGPVDFISSIEILDKKNAVQDGTILSDASKYKNFNLGDTTISMNHHSMNGNECFEAETFKNLNDFIYYYNFNSDKEYKFRDVTIHNYHFFLLNDSSFENKKNQIKPRITFKDGRNILRGIE